MTATCDVNVDDGRISVHCPAPMTADEALELAARLHARALEVKGHKYAYGAFNLAVAEAAASELEHHLDHSANALDICAFMMHRDLLSDYFYGGWDDGVRNVWEAYANANDIKKLTDDTAVFELTVSPSRPSEEGAVRAAAMRAVMSAVVAALETDEIFRSAELTDHDLSDPDEDGYVEVAVTVSAAADEHIDRFEDAATVLAGMSLDGGCVVTDVSVTAPAAD